MSDDICPHCGLPYSPEDSRETKPRTCQCCQAWHRRDTEADGRALLALGHYLFKHGLRGLDLSCTKAAMLALDQGRAEVARLTELLRDVATCGQVMPDRRMRYTEVQIDWQTWDALAQFRMRGGGK